MNPISFMLYRRRHRARMANLEHIEREQAAQDALALRALFCSIDFDFDDASLLDHVTVLIREHHQLRERVGQQDSTIMRLQLKLADERAKVTNANRQADDATRTGTELALAYNGTLDVLTDLAKMVGLDYTDSRRGNDELLQTVRRRLDQLEEARAGVLD